MVGLVIEAHNIMVTYDDSIMMQNVFRYQWWKIFNKITSLACLVAAGLRVRAILFYMRGRGKFMRDSQRKRLSFVNSDVKDPRGLSPRRASAALPTWCNMRRAT